MPAHYNKHGLAACYDGMMTAQQHQQLFIETVWNYYADHGRDLPWRQPEADGQFDPYKIMVSEIMLQQTQVNRVLPKYQQFLDLFPSVIQLAKAPLSDVLIAWSGLGYNRRAKFLHQAAQAIAGRSNGFPTELDELVALPGIGRNTAGAIVVYAYNQPALFIETNVRTVYIHHFMPDRLSVNDRSIEDLLRVTLDQTNPRLWYWALMDYGSHLKRTVGNVSRASQAYTKQSRFSGSVRQIRGQVLKALLQGPQSQANLEAKIPDERLKLVLAALVRDGLVGHNSRGYQLAK